MGFVFEPRPSDSPFVDRVYRTETGSVGSFLSVATTRWALVVTRQRGRTRVTLRGPERRATLMKCPAEAEFLGVVFRPGTVLPDLPASRLVDRDLDLPNAGARTFWLKGAAWQVPQLESVESFLARLAREGLVQRDPVVEAALRGEPIDVSPRTVQRAFRRTTGLSHRRIRSIERAQAAARLLQRGLPIAEVAHRSGYYDQAHLTTALKRLIGQTPAQLSKVPVPKSLF